MKNIKLEIDYQDYVEALKENVNTYCEDMVVEQIVKKLYEDNKLKPLEVYDSFRNRLDTYHNTKALDILIQNSNISQCDFREKYPMCLDFYLSKLIKGEEDSKLLDEIIEYLKNNGALYKQYINYFIEPNEGIVIYTFYHNGL